MTRIDINSYYWICDKCNKRMDKPNRHYYDNKLGKKVHFHNECFEGYKE